MTINVADDTALFLSTDGFGETVSFTPYGGGARDLDGKFFDGQLNADPYTRDAVHERPAFLTASADVQDITHQATIIRDGITYECESPSISEVQFMPFVLIFLQVVDP